MTKKIFISKKKLKGHNKRFHKLASELPMSHYLANERFADDLPDLEANEIKNSTHGLSDSMSGVPDVQIVSAPKRGVFIREQYYPINHFKRLRTAYSKEGEIGVAKYIKSVYQNNEKILKEHQMKVSMMSIEEILKHKIQPLFK